MNEMGVPQFKAQNEVHCSARMQIHT